MRHIRRTGAKETYGDSVVIIIIIAVQPSEVYSIEGSFTIRDRLSLLFGGNRRMKPCMRIRGTWNNFHGLGSAGPSLKDVSMWNKGQLQPSNNFSQRLPVVSLG